MKGYQATKTSYKICRSNWKCGVPCSRALKNFKTAAAEHRTEPGTLCVTAQAPRATSKVPASHFGKCSCSYHVHFESNAWLRAVSTHRGTREVGVCVCVGAAGTSGVMVLSNHIAITQCKRNLCRFSPRVPTTKPALSSLSVHTDTHTPPADGWHPCVPNGRAPDSQILVTVSCFAFLLWSQALISKTDLYSPHFPVGYLTHSRHSLPVLGWVL